MIGKQLVSSGNDATDGQR